jgi:hypothetical protein
MIRLVWLVLVLVACSASITSPPPGEVPDGCADVIEVVVAAEPGGTYRFDVTVRSADTGWEKYVDAWEVRAPDGSVLGTRFLTHPHVDEQPFTRSLTGVGVPGGVEEVEVAARDLADGFCGQTLTVPIP